MNPSIEWPRIEKPRGRGIELVLWLRATHSPWKKGATLKQGGMPVSIFNFTLSIPAAEFPPRSLKAQGLQQASVRIFLILSIMLLHMLPKYIQCI